VVDAGRVASIAGQSEARHVQSIEYLTTYRIAAIEFVKALLTSGYNPSTNDAKVWIVAMGPRVLAANAGFADVAHFFEMCEKENMPDKQAQMVEGADWCTTWKHLTGVAVAAVETDRHIQTQFFSVLGKTWKNLEATVNKCYTACTPSKKFHIVLAEKPSTSHISTLFQQDGDVV
jgi:hypothetical protein